MNLVAPGINLHTITVFNSKKSEKIISHLNLEQLHKKKPHRITIPTTDGLQFINLDDIVNLEASNNYTYIYLSTKQKLLVSRTNTFAAKVDKS